MVCYQDSDLYIMKSKPKYYLLQLVMQRNINENSGLTIANNIMNWTVKISFRFYEDTSQKNTTDSDFLENNQVKKTKSSLLEPRSSVEF